MEDRFFYNADGEMLIVPESGRLLIHSEMGRLEVTPGEIAILPRGLLNAASALVTTEISEGVECIQLSEFGKPI